MKVINKVKILMGCGNFEFEIQIRNSYLFFGNVTELTVLLTIYYIYFQIFNMYVIIKRFKLQFV